MQSSSSDATVHITIRMLFLTNLVGFVSGSVPPRKRPFDLLSRRFFMNEYANNRSQGNGTTGCYQAPKDYVEHLDDNLHCF